MFMHFSIPLNANEIIILGGHLNEKPVHLYDGRTDSCKSVNAHGAFTFINSNSGNYPIAQCGLNKVVALVSHCKPSTKTDLGGFRPYFIQYVKETNTITILDKFGDIEVTF